MLVLSRKTGQEIVFPELGITISVVKARDGLARLGITAPKNVQVHRKEIANLIAGKAHAKAAKCESAS